MSTTVTRWKPNVQPSQDLATPTMGRDQHHLFHSAPGDIAGKWDGETVLKNWFICGHYAHKADAETMLAAVGTVRPGIIESWVRPTPSGKTTRRTHTVLAQDCTTPQAAALRALLPAPNPVATKKTRQADTNGAAQRTQRSAQRTPPASAAQDIHALAASLGVDTYALLIGTSDVQHAADVRERFLSACMGQRGNWRVFWTQWAAAQLPSVQTKKADSAPLSALKNAVNQAVQRGDGPIVEVTPAQAARESARQGGRAPLLDSNSPAADGKWIDRKPSAHVRFVPFKEHMRDAEGTLMEIINRGHGAHIHCPLPGDPNRILRVWAQDGTLHEVSYLKPESRQPDTNSEPSPTDTRIAAMLARLAARKTA